MPTDPTPDREPVSVAEQFTEADVELVATATEAHHIVFGQTDAMGNNPCVCDRWWDSADGPGWDEHMAEVALSALAAAGRLRNADPNTLAGPSVQRTVDTTWLPVPNTTTEGDQR